MPTPEDQANDPRPTPPERPDPVMCCGRGCTPCVYDFYDEALYRYELALKEWQSRHPPPTIE